MADTESSTKSVEHDDLPEGGQPALFQHCMKVFKAMEEESDPYEDSDEYSVYTGFTTHLFKEIGLSIPYYSRVTKLLKEMDCIRQLSRGGGNAPSQWLLIQEPTIEAFDKAADRIGAGRVMKQSKTVMLEQQIRDLAERVTDLEAVVEELVARA